MECVDYTFGVPNPVEDEFLPARESISWAELAVNELAKELHDFFSGDVAEIVTEDDPITGGRIQKLKFKGQLPKQTRRKATEALTSTKHSFDQAIYAACKVLGRAGSRSLYFPWARSPIDLDHLLKSRGINERLWDTIRETQPCPKSDNYPGGDELSRILATIANRKHTVGLAVHGEMVEATYPPMGGDNHGLSIRFGDGKWDPQKNEIRILSWVGPLKMDGEYNFKFMISLRDPLLPDFSDGMFALRYFISRAGLVCDALTGKCIELRG